ncbi:MAG: hypothetical protein AW09_000428 [Candidatus Accumulibacter phosphatis]|uniref:Uncharacterized protein n=1 Tax=Candidatus Accumulibacter phosphatis TaxID=327160 RepID=A0A080LZM6_9PROT|nr:MAG: hypothetical protein AW09_000428 [Candidatus Accumulibacter phosphatis]
MLAHRLRHPVVTVAEGDPVHHATARSQGINRRVDPLGRLNAREDDSGVEVGEDRTHCRVGHVVSGDIDGLDGGDVAAARGRNALLQFRHFGEQCRLVANRRLHAPEQPRQLAARLHEAESVVHQEQHFLRDMVAQVFGIGQCRQADAEADSRRFVHLPEHHQRARHDAGVLHVVPELMSFANALTDSGEDRYPLVQVDDGVHEFHDQHRLADTGATEQAGLAAAHEGTQEVDHLDAGRQDFSHAERFRKRRRGRDDGANAPRRCNARHRGRHTPPDAAAAGGCTGCR